MMIKSVMTPILFFLVYTVIQNFSNFHLLSLSDGSYEFLDGTFIVTYKGKKKRHKGEHNHGSKLP